MYVIWGQSAYSNFQLKRRQARLQAQVPGAQIASACYVYCLETEAPLASSTRDAVLALLDGRGFDDERDNDGPIFPHGTCIVTPRLGTVSPWSSKATNIFHNCELTSVRCVERGIAYWLEGAVPEQCGVALYDPLTESLSTNFDEVAKLFNHEAPRPLTHIPFMAEGASAIADANERLGLALSEAEVDYLVTMYEQLQRDPTDIELMMFGQVNSEHCRHKIFNADWTIDGEAKAKSLFAMIRNTHQAHPDNVLSAYADNGAVLAGHKAHWFVPDSDGHTYQKNLSEKHITIKVETHNHPTGISPHPGAATGAGGEIRDEGAIGRGGVPKAGLTGFSVSHLNIPGYTQKWETGYGHAPNMASALDIMIEGPIGGAAFNNEFGRPNICGYFRNFELSLPDDTHRGYHKPIMVAGGLGNIAPEQVTKLGIPVGAKIVVLGGPAMAIGLGGGTASSVNAGDSDAALDFASVQRANPEMQRRCQETINRCFALGTDNPILSIHDVGAGGLSNALPELIHDAGRGGVFQLRDIPSAESGMSPLEIWCNEAQERYVFAIAPEALSRFESIAQRERCEYAIVGEATESQDLKLYDTQFENHAIDVPLQTLLGKTPKMQRNVVRAPAPLPLLDCGSIDILDAAEQVLQFPAVADKTFLITIGDRSVGGMVARDQMVGPWQIPVADVGVTANDFDGYSGEAMAMGERTPLALIDSARAAKMAVGEAITNIAAAPIDKIGDIKLSANWMVAAGEPGESAGLYAAVEAIGEELCPALGIAIPVGKDSMSMRATWRDGARDKKVVAPSSLVITAFAPVSDVRKTLTPELKTDAGPTQLLYIDLGAGHNPLGGSVLAQCYQQFGEDAPTVESATQLKQFFAAIQSLSQADKLLAYHDRSDGGLFATLCEMAFAGHTGLRIGLDTVPGKPLEILFTEALGAVIQVRECDVTAVINVLFEQGLGDNTYAIGVPSEDDRLFFAKDGQVLLDNTRIHYQQLWSRTSYEMQKLRDNPVCADEAFENIARGEGKLSASLTFEIQPTNINTGVKPKIAVLREQGVNGQVEAAAAFDRAGFTAVDVHMSDLLSGRVNLTDFKGLVAPGGFSYGDVLGAGQGWARAILFHDNVREALASFFQRTDTFALGVCNGCQMLSSLKHIIPGAEHWPQFKKNTSEQYEARLTMVTIEDSPSIFLQGMAGSRLPVVVAHGEGRAEWQGNAPRPDFACLRYTDEAGQGTMRYPMNPNGSPDGVTGLTSADGRFTIMMPHPERIFRTLQHSWHPAGWGEDSPWMQMFYNARKWLDS